LLGAVEPPSSLVCWGLKPFMLGVIVIACARGRRLEVHS
jgi:hypothetical protein